MFVLKWSFEYANSSFNQTQRNNNFNFWRDQPGVCLGKEAVSPGRLWAFVIQGVLVIVAELGGVVGAADELYGTAFALVIKIYRGVKVAAGRA